MNLRLFLKLSFVVFVVGFIPSPAIAQGQVYDAPLFLCSFRPVLKCAHLQLIVTVILQRTFTQRNFRIMVTHTFISTSSTNVASKTEIILKLSSQNLGFSRTSRRELPPPPLPLQPSATYAVTNRRFEAKSRAVVACHTLSAGASLSPRIANMSGFSKRLHRAISNSPKQLPKHSSTH